MTQHRSHGKPWPAIAFDANMRVLRLRCLPLIAPEQDRHAHTHTCEEIRVSCGGIGTIRVLVHWRAPQSMKRRLLNSFFSPDAGNFLDLILILKHGIKISASTR
jgi:hypothetical protein